MNAYERPRLNRRNAETEPHFSEPPALEHFLEEQDEFPRSREYLEKAQAIDAS